MTATDELRRMLTEAEVEYTTEGVETFYGRHCHAWPINDNDLCVSMAYITPAQAIAATLARGTCHKVLDFDGAAWICSECGEHIGPRRWNYCPNCGAKVVDE